MICEPSDLTGPFLDAKARAVQCFETAYLDTLMQRCGGNLLKASREADMARNHLRALLKRRGLYRLGRRGRPPLLVSGQKSASGTGRPLRYGLVKLPARAAP